MENNDTPFDITFALDIVHNLCNVSPSLLDIEGHFDYTDEDVILDMDTNDNTEHNEPLGFIRIGLKQEATGMFPIMEQWYTRSKE